MSGLIWQRRVWIQEPLTMEVILQKRTERLCWRNVTRYILNSSSFPWKDSHAGNGEICQEFMAVTDFLNSGPSPVCFTDLLIYVIRKQFQWAYPPKNGEGKFVWLLGRLHSEMVAWSMIWSLLTYSGWTGIISETDLATGGASESLLETTQLMKTRRYSDDPGFAPTLKTTQLLWWPWICSNAENHAVTLMTLDLPQREAIKDGIFCEKKKWSG